MCDKQVRLFYEGYMINGNENEAENKIQVTQIQNKQALAQTWTQIY